MADAGDLKSPARNGRVGSTPTSATTYKSGAAQVSPITMSRPHNNGLKGQYTLAQGNALGQIKSSNKSP